MSLQNKIYLSNIIRNTLFCIITILYSFFALQQDISIIPILLPHVAFLVFVFFLILFSSISYIFSRDIFAKNKIFESGSMNIQEKTMLLDNFIRLPVKYRTATFLFMSCTSLSCYIYTIYNKTGILGYNTIAFAECLFCSYNIAFISAIRTDRMCKKASFSIVQSGIDPLYVKNKKWLGISIKKQLVMQVIVPVILSMLIAVSILIFDRLNGLSVTVTDFSNLQVYRTVMIRIIMILLLNTVLELYVIHSFYKQIKIMNNNISSILESMYSRNNETDMSLNTDISDELSYNHYLSNEMFKFLKSILTKASDIGFNIVEGSNNLMNIASTTENIAVDQSSSVKEIVATMQDSNYLSKNIEAKINEVTDMMTNTAIEVNNGSKVLEENISKINEITNYNQNTIQGIKTFNEKVSSIWEIVNIINSIADQTKIIAFNAELEATNVHDKGKSFKNVANGIRRLANNTMDSTKDIKIIIDQIQNASDRLLQSALDSNNQIKQGSTLVSSLDRLFQNIKDSANTNSDSATEIRELISQQTYSFEQILITLKHISSEVDKFSVYTGNIIDTAGMLQESVDELDSIEYTSDEMQGDDDDGYNIEI